MTYTIENETNRIQAHAGATQAAAIANAERFKSEAELGKLAASWPGARLIEIWNALPGVTPVKKFKDRATGVGRIWKAIQPEKEAVVAEAVTDAEVEAEVTPESVPTAEPFEPPIVPEIATESKPNATPEPTTTPEDAHSPDVATEEAPTSAKPTRAKKARKAAKEPKASNAGSKTASILDLIRREGGATLAEIMEATGWQAHSVRGFVSGTLTKKMGLTVVSAKGEDGVRRYSIKA